MSQAGPSSRLSAAALREFEQAAEAGWEGGVPLAELLDRVNRVAAGFLPEDGGGSTRDTRVKRMFTDRSFRRYQTLGAIDPPEKDGRTALYGLRHFLQALLVRKLLWDRVPAERVAALMAGRGTEEVKRMLLGGVEFVARAGAGETGFGPEPVDSTEPEMWRCIRVAPGVELHVCEGTRRPKPAELERWLRTIEQAVRRHLR